MGVLNVEMKPGLKVYVEGHLDPADQTSPYIQTNAMIMEYPHFMDDFIKVRLDEGVNGAKNQIIKVSKHSIYWRKQG